MCSPFSCKELFVKKTFRSFQDVILTYRNFPESECDHLCWGKLHDELLFLGGEGNPLVINQVEGTISTAAPGTCDCCVLSGV